MCSITYKTLFPLCNRLGGFTSITFLFYLDKMSIHDIHDVNIFRRFYFFNTYEPSECHDYLCRFVTLKVKFSLFLNYFFYN